MKRITVDVGEENNAIGVMVQNMEPYDSIVALIYTALALLEGRAQVTFGENPLTEEEQEEMMPEGCTVGTGGHRDN